MASVLGRVFVDTDALLGEEPRTLYDRVGEKKFREIEKQVVRGLQVEGCVIATGGGVPLDAENRAFLREIGTVVFLNMPITTRNPRFDYDARLGIYMEMAHHVIQTEEALWAVIRSDPFSVSPPGVNRTALPSALSSTVALRD